ncbi:MAG: thioredoxin family protein [Actinobacteria bacterium]|nr:thioredoxin family protein [Actinomycetota bacterium]
MQVTLLYFDGCPNWEATHRRLETLAGELGFDLVSRTVDTPEQAEALTFRGSPTVLVDGRDPFATGGEPVGLACRVYATDDVLAGAPTEQQLRDALKTPH